MLRTRIGAFLETKALLANSRAAYGYDLEQFCQQVADQLGPASLAAYEVFLQGLASSASRRKRSAVNQFLRYLYDQGELAVAYRLREEKRPLPKLAPAGRLDLAQLWEPTPHQAGQLIALLIWQLGLTPSQLLDLQASALNLEFEVLTVKRGQELRVLKMPASLRPYLLAWPTGTYLFDKKGQPYTRQWFFRQLKTYLASLGLEQVTAQSLREQYLLEQVATGTSPWDLAKELGLKSPASLDKYFK